jgi:hypothetical protein
MKIKTAELVGRALDWVVATTLNPKAKDAYTGSMVRRPMSYTARPSTDWAQGGPIIERECMTISALYAQKNPPSPEYAHGEWGAYIPCGVNSEAAGRGPTPLIAAMRCFVASKLGDEVDVPEELLK